MSDITEATESSLKKLVGAVECTFNYLTAYDRAELLRADLKARRDEWDAGRAQLLADLDASGIEGPQKFTELQAYAENRPLRTSEADWISFVNDPLNEPAICETSLRSTHKDASDLAKKARLSLAEKAKICGLALITVEDSDPNPTPPAYGTGDQNSTGAKPVTESNTTSPT